MAGFLDFSSPNAPGVVPLSPGAQGILNDQISTSAQPSSYFSNQINQNTDAGLNQFPSEEKAGQQAASAGTPNETFGAIRGMYAKKAGQQIGNIMKMNDLEATKMKGDYMNQTAKALLNQQALQTNQYGVYTNAYQQQEQARAGMINQLFQLGTTAGTIGYLNSRGAGGGSAPTSSGNGSYAGQGALGNYNF